MADVIERAAQFLNQCGSCDAGLPMACTCSTEDYRPVMLDLVREVERLRAKAETTEAEAWRSAHKAGGLLLSGLRAARDRQAADIVESYRVAVEHHLTVFGFPPDQGTRVTETKPSGGAS